MVRDSRRRDKNCKAKRTRDVLLERGQPEHELPPARDERQRIVHERRAPRRERGGTLSLRGQSMRAPSSRSRGTWREYESVVKRVVVEIVVRGKGAAG